MLIEQNAGIGVVNPTKGGLDVVNGSGAVATSLFGADGRKYYPGSDRRLMDILYK